MNTSQISTAAAPEMGTSSSTIKPSTSNLIAEKIEQIGLSGIHVVNPGDTLSSIAESNLTLKKKADNLVSSPNPDNLIVTPQEIANAVDKIKAVNGLKSDTIFPGQELIIVLPK